VPSQSKWLAILCKLRQDSSNHTRPRRSFHDKQFFNRLAITEAAADGGDVVHAVDIRRKLLIRAVLRDLLDAPVQIPDDALRANHALAIEFQLEPPARREWRDAVVHINDQLIRAQHRLVIVCGFDAQSRLLS